MRQRSENALAQSALKRLKAKEDANSQEIRNVSAKLQSLEQRSNRQIDKLTVGRLGRTLSGFPADFWLLPGGEARSASASHNAALQGRPLAAHAAQA